MEKGLFNSATTTEVGDFAMKQYRAICTTLSHKLDGKKNLTFSSINEAGEIDPYSNRNLDATIWWESNLEIEVGDVVLFSMEKESKAVHVLKTPASAETIRRVLGITKEQEAAAAKALGKKGS